MQIHHASSKKNHVQKSKDRAAKRTNSKEESDKAKLETLAAKVLAIL